MHSTILSVYPISRRVEGARVFKPRASRPTGGQAAIEEVKTDDERLGWYHTSPANPVRPTHDSAHPELAATNLELSTGSGLLLKLFSEGERGGLLD